MTNEIEYKEILSIDCSHYNKFQLSWAKFSLDGQILCSSSYTQQNNVDKYSKSELLSHYCEDLRVKTSGTYENLSAVTVCLGPGSFTGSRSSLAFAKGLCAGLSDCRLVGVSSFEIVQFAYQEYDPLFSVIDARSNSYYCSFCDKKARSSNTEISIMIQDAQDIVFFLMQTQETHSRIFLSGPAAQQVHTKLIADHPILQQKIVLPALSWNYVANLLTDIGIAKTLRGEFSDPHCSPIYIKNAVQQSVD